MVPGRLGRRARGGGGSGGSSGAIAGKGSWLVDGSVSIRNLNGALGMSLSTGGPKTLNGYITETLEMIPVINTSLLLDDHPVDILQIKENMVKTVRIHPRLQEQPTADNTASTP